MGKDGLNKVEIVGILRKDPEMRYTVHGRAITTFIAELPRVESGPRLDPPGETDWFHIVTWDRLAEECNQKLRRGSRVYLQGRLESRNRYDVQGKPRRRVEILAAEMQILDYAQDE